MMIGNAQNDPARGKPHCTIACHATQHRVFEDREQCSNPLLQAAGAPALGRRYAIPGSVQALDRGCFIMNLIFDPIPEYAGAWKTAREG